MAGAAAVAAVPLAAWATLGRPAAPASAGPPMIVLMDSQHPERVYDSATRQAAWMTGVERRFPAIKGRLASYMVPLDRATFRDPRTGDEIRKIAVAMLGL